jgi:prepilin-type processing-associated H-X9-DG protein
MRITLCKVWRTIAGLILTGLLCTAAGADEAELTRVLPPGAIATIWYAGGEKLAPDYEASALGQVMNDPQMQAFLRKPKQSFLNEVTKQTNAPSAEVIRQIKRWLVAKQSSFAVYADPDLGVVGCTRLGNDAENARKLLDTMAKGHGTSTRTSGVYTVTVTADKIEFAVARDTFVFANYAERMDKVLARIDTGTSDAGMRAPTLPVGKPIGWAMLDVPGLLTRVRTEFKGEQEAAKFNGVTSALGIDAFRTIAIASGFDGPAIRMVSRVPAVAAERGVLGWYGSTPLDEKALKMVPQNAIVASVARFNAAAAWDTVMGAIEAGAGREGYQEIQNKLGDVERELQFKFRDEMIASLGETVAFYTKPGMPAMMMGGEAAVVIALKDAKTFTTCLEKLSDYLDKAIAKHPPRQPPPPVPQFAIKQTDISGTRIYYLAGMPMMMPAWGVKGEHFYLGLSPQTVQAAIAQVENPQSSLLDNEDFKNSRKHLPEKVVAIGYEDTRQTVAAFYAMAAMFGPMFAGHPNAPIDVGLLPPLSTVQSKLFGTVQAVTIDRDGFTTQVYSPIGLQLGGFGGAQAGFMAGLLLPALNQAREKARQATCLSNLRQIGLACHMHADQHNGKFPDKLEDLSSDILPNRKVLTCPSSKLPDGQNSYVYISGLTPGDTDKILAYDADGNHRLGRNVLYADGHALWMTEAEFQNATGRSKNQALKFATPTPAAH